jgi:precorrin-2 dehydrogenase / sirohydrochlorin ferrochelatase
MASDLYPITVKVADRPVLVVGGGTIAAFKIAGLLRCGARITVVSPEANDEVRELARRGAIRWLQRGFEPADVEGSLLVVSAVDDRTVTDAVVSAAHDHNLLVNAVDDPQRCDYYLPAVVRRGPLSLAVSTAGASPGFAGVLARELDESLPDHLETWLELLSEARATLLERYPDEPGVRHRLAKALASSDAREHVTAGDLGVARDRLKAIIEQEES